VSDSDKYLLKQENRVLSPVAILHGELLYQPSQVEAEDVVVGVHLGEAVGG
jgi:hypothetical protein